MRWYCSSLAVVAVTAGCVTTTTRSFLPSPRNPVYTPQQAEPVLAEYVRLQCGVLREAQKADSGSASFAVDVDSSGAATRAQLQRTTHDDVLDGVFGTVAAQLRFAADSARRRPGRREVRVQYRCAGDSAAVRLVSPAG